MQKRMTGNDDEVCFLGPNWLFLSLQPFHHSEWIESAATRGANQMVCLYKLQNAVYIYMIIYIDIYIYDYVYSSLYIHRYVYIYIYIL